VSEQTPDVQPGTELVPVQTSIEVPVAQTEGEFIRKMQGKIPSLTIDMPVGYKRGTYLELRVVMRVRGIAVDDVKVNRELVPTRIHTLVYEDVQLVAAHTEDPTGAAVETNDVDF